MAIVKPTETGQERRKERLEALRSRLADIKELGAMRNYPEWKKLKSTIESFAEMEKRLEEKGIIDCCKKQGVEPWELVADIRVAREKRAAFEFVIDMVEKTDVQVEHLHNTIKDLEQEYKLAKTKLA